MYNHGILSWVTDYICCFQETDYAMSYFDNGEGYGDDDDGDEEGPVY